MALQSNAISHWLGANLESALVNDLTDCVFLVCQQQGLGPHPGSSAGSLRTSVAATHHDDVILLVRWVLESHGQMTQRNLTGNWYTPPHSYATCNKKCHNEIVTKNTKHLHTMIMPWSKPGLGLIQLWNWNCGSIPIPILELELELKLVELKMELELKMLELELKTWNEIYCISIVTIA